MGTHASLGGNSSLSLHYLLVKSFKISLHCLARYMVLLGQIYEVDNIRFRYIYEDLNEKFIA